MTGPAAQSDQSPAKLLWEPGDVEETLLYKFAQDTGHAPDFNILHKWSIEQPEEFWTAVWDQCGVIGDKGEVVIETVDHVPWARFFEGSKISYAENMLARVQVAPDAPAIISRIQDGADHIITWQALASEVSRWEQALRAAGISEGDRVGIYLPNVSETIMILIAASNIGAPISTAGMEMGPDDLINRFGQVEPKILITTNGYVHGKKEIDRTDVIARVQEEIASLEKTVMLGDGFLDDFEPAQIAFIRRDFNHPLYIPFSSGSTGKPKCFEHSTGGVFLKHVVEHKLHCDVRPGDHLFYHATPSWMMWNWLASGLAMGATILMYDGSPAYPDAYAQWDFTASNGCTHHGTAAPVILSWAANDVVPKDKYDLSPLRMIMSTGAVLPAQGFDYIHEKIKADIKISSISGGTDIVGCFLGGNPLMPTYAGQINGPVLGMDVQVWDDEGQPTNLGELVCTNPFPSMPLRFLGDDGSRYSEEYFEHYPGQKVWRHGDSIAKTAEGQFIIIGRSDATLNQNGVRIGASAIYDQLEEFADQMGDFAAVDFTKPSDKQTIIVLFLEIDEISEELEMDIKKAVKDGVGPYSVPTEIIAVPGILKTPNGKKAEVVMKKIINGTSIPNPSLYGENLVQNFDKIARALTGKYG